MSWSQSAWQSGQAWVTHLEQSPFIRGLASGHLERASFVWHVTQNAHFLAGFGQALALVAARCPDSPRRVLLARDAADMAERAAWLHSGYLAQLGVGQPERAAPSTAHYTRYLLATAALAPYEVACAGLLPGLWIYAHLAQHVAEIRTTEDNAYDTWIDAAEHARLARDVSRWQGWCDQLADGSLPATRLAMTEAWQEALRLECLMMDAAFARERWPI